MSALDKATLLQEPSTAAAPSVLHSNSFAKDKEQKRSRERVPGYFLHLPLSSN